MGDGVMDLVMSDVLMERVAEVGLGVDRGMDWVHVPTPGDHYSPGTGSAIMTIIYEISRVHAERGGRTRVVVSRGTCEGYPPYEVGEVVEADLPLSLPSRPQRAVDALMGRAVLRRPVAAGQFRGVVEAMGRDFDGMLFVHNAPAAMPMLRERLPSARLCLYVHNQLFNTYSRREMGHVLGCCDAAICVSRFIADDIAARLGRWSDKLKVVHNGVDTERFRPGEVAPADGLPVVLFLGRVVPEKGPDLLLKAARVLHERGLDFRVRIVGSSGFNAKDPLSAYELELRELARPLGKKVAFVPFVDRGRVVDEYKGASVFCVPSNWDEPLGLTVLEGMACGLPVVASRRGGIPEIGGEAVLYFDPPDVSELAGHLEGLLRDEADRCVWGERARTRAQQLSWDRQHEHLAEAVGMETAVVSP
jgi:glycosyltransferase involved in cell wall biosynthesis